MYEREEVRIDAKEACTVTILGHPDVSVPCEIKNFSRSGMCITVHDSISTGNAVKVNWADHFLVGRVRRVSADGSKFNVGLELLYCSIWKGAVAPKAGA